MYNPSWDRWIYASVTKYFSDNANQSLYKIFFEGDDYDENDFDKFPKRVEFRMDGPTTQETSKNCFKLDFEINCVVTVNRNDKTVHDIYKVTGHLNSLFKHAIPVFKFGTEAGDDGSLLGCLSLRTDLNQAVVVSHLGQVEQRTVVLQATIEGHYRIILET